MATSVSRRRVLAGVASSCALIAGCQTNPVEERIGDSWPLPRRGPGRTGFNPEATGPAVGREQWQLDTDAPAATPVVAGETAYVGGDAVFAFAKDDGTTRWQRSLPFDTRSPPAVADGTVYATSKFAYYAIDATTGRDIWVDNEGGVRYHAPVPVDGRLYLAATAIGDPEFSASVVARDADDGTEQWRAAVGNRVLPPFAPAIASGNVYVGRDAVYALDAQSGDQQWRFESSEVTAFGDPAVTAGRVYVSGTRPTTRSGPPAGVVFALDADTGDEVWRFGTGLRPSAPAVTDERVFVTSDAVYALSAEEGTVLWQIEDNRYVTASPAATRTRVYLAGVEGTVHVLSGEDGGTVWRLPTAEPVLTAPAVTDSQVFVAGAGGRVMAFGEGS